MKLKEAEITEHNSRLVLLLLPTDYESPFFRSCSEQEANNQWTQNPLEVDVGDVNSKHLILPLKPTDYESPFFRSCSEQEANNQWTQNPLEVDVGDVNSKHLILALKMRNLLRIVSYIRGLFPVKYFNDKAVLALGMKAKKLMPMNAESRRLIDWMEVKNWFHSFYNDSVELTDVLSKFAFVPMVNIIIDPCGVEGEDLQGSATVKIRGHSDGCPYCTLPYLKPDSWRSSKDPPSPKECVCSAEDKATRREEDLRRQAQLDEDRAKATEKLRVEWTEEIRVKLYYVDCSFQSDLNTSDTLTITREELPDFEDFTVFLKEVMNQSVLPPDFVTQFLWLSYKDAEGRCFDLNSSSWSEFTRVGVSADARIVVQRDFRKPFLRGTSAYNAMVFWGHAKGKEALLTESELIESGLHDGSVKFLYFSYNCPVPDVSEIVRLAQVAKDLDVPFVFSSNEKMVKSYYGVLGERVLPPRLNAAVTSHGALRDVQGDIWGVYVRRQPTADAAGNADVVGTAAEVNNTEATDEVSAPSLTDDASLADVGAGKA